MIHTYAFHVRFGDVDAYGMVNNVRFLGYLEDARVAMLLTDPVKRGEEGLGESVVTRHEIDYLKALRFRPEPLRVETVATKVGAATFELAYEVRDDDHVYATAHTAGVAYDVGEGRPRRLTPAERALLRRHLRGLCRIGK